MLSSVCYQTKVLRIGKQVLESHCQVLVFERNVFTIKKTKQAQKITFLRDSNNSLAIITGCISSIDVQINSFILLEGKSFKT